MNKWISVKDEVPEHLQMVLGCGSDGTMMVVRCDLHKNGNEIIDYVFMSPTLSHQILGITHWMELPDSPIRDSRTANDSVGVSSSFSERLEKLENSRFLKSSTYVPLFDRLGKIDNRITAIDANIDAALAEHGQKYIDLLNQVLALNERVRILEYYKK